MNENNQIWVDKYRPQKFDEIIGQEQFVKRVKAFVDSKNLPHLLFTGSPGTGKTTTAHVIAKELYGKDSVRGNFLELNASDDRGIDVIRNQIKEFARLKSLADIPYKIICLDEADSLTKEAQQALRRTMEKYSASCRFVLACNELSKLIDPIQSRCVIFKFKPLKNEDIMKFISQIEKSEDFTIDAEAKEFLITISRGDLRKITNSLQAAVSVSKKIDTKVIQEVLEIVNPKDVKVMLDFSLKGDFFAAREELIKLRSIRGLTGIEILKELYRLIIEIEELEPKTKVKLIDRIATVEYRIVEGSDEELQIEGLLAMMALVK